jgi:hypothetical protein
MIFNILIISYVVASQYFLIFKGDDVRAVIYMLMAVGFAILIRLDEIYEQKR